MEIKAFAEDFEHTAEKLHYRTPFVEQLFAEYLIVF